MGSWDATCNISQLPITCGTPVRVLFLTKCPYSMDPPNELRLDKEGNNSREGCYSTDFWFPRTVAIKATYADYGEVTDLETGIIQDLFWKQLNEDLIEVPEGENQYHEPKSHKEMTWDKLWEVVREGRLRVNGSYGRSEQDYNIQDLLERWEKRTPAKPVPLPVCGVMIREDVYQGMLKLVNQNFDGKVTPDSIVEELFKLHKEHSQSITGTNQEQLSFGGLSFKLNQEVGRFNKPFTLGIGFFLEHAFHGRNHTENTNEIVRRVAEMIHVCRLYDALRKAWHPGAGVGSQGVEFELAGQFHETMAHLSYAAFEEEEIKRAEWDDEHSPRKANHLGFI